MSLRMCFPSSSFTSNIACGLYVEASFLTRPSLKKKKKKNKKKTRPSSHSSKQSTNLFVQYTVIQLLFLLSVQSAPLYKMALGNQSKLFNLI